MNLRKLFKTKKHSKHTEESSKRNIKHTYTSPTGRQVETQMITPVDDKGFLINRSISNILRDLEFMYNPETVSQNKELQELKNILILKQKQRELANTLFVSGKAATLLIKYDLV